MTVNAYVSSENYIINEKPRSGMDLSEDEIEFMYNFDSALEKISTFDGTLYHSMNSDMITDIDDFLVKHHPVSWVTYNAYTSASLEVYDESIDMQCIIISKNGRDITVYNPEESTIHPTTPEITK